MITPIKYDDIPVLKRSWTGTLYRRVKDQYQDCLNYYNSNDVIFSTIQNPIQSAVIIMFLEYVKEHKV